MCRAPGCKEWLRRRYAGTCGFARPLAAIIGECLFQEGEIVRLRAEITNVAAQISRFADGHVHLRTGVAVKTVAFQFSRADFQLLKNFSECQTGGGRSGAA